MQPDSSRGSADALLHSSGAVPPGEHPVLGKAAIRRPGRDITLASFAKTVDTCMAAAASLAEVAAIAADQAFVPQAAAIVEQTLLMLARPQLAAARTNQPFHSN